MSKVGILSMQRIFNYGSFLQAYGLKKMVEELGNEVQFVDYHPGECLEEGHEGSGIKRKILKALETLRYDAPLKEKLKFIKYKKNYAKNNYCYLGINEEHNYAPKLDTLIIGSDEVFNCVQSNTNVGFSPELFGVGNNAQKLISYAASFGNTTLAKLEKYDKKNIISNWLSKFDAISVRDENSYRIIKELLGRNPEMHLDPVLAYDYMNKCSEIKDYPLDDNYMIVYGYSGRFNKEECRYIREYAKKKNLKILCIGGIQSCCDEFVDCSPFDVITYFKYADGVVTDTFHGTILSVITHRKFATFIRRVEYGNSEKLTDLLAKLKLSNQIVANISELENVLSNAIDYTETDKIISENRSRTYEYLKQQLV